MISAKISIRLRGLFVAKLLGFVNVIVQIQIRVFHGDGWLALLQPVAVG